MPKVSRPVIYTALAAVAAYALFLNTQPDTPTTHRTVRAPASARPADPNGILPADLKAHFPRYAGGRRDPFAPGVVIARPRVQAAAPPKLGGGRTGWALTGINSVNGVRSALIENSATGDSVFLRPGDQWNGMRVAAVQPSAVLFRDAQGHQDTLTFASPPDDSSGASGGATRSASGGAAGRPSAPSLPPFPVAPLRVQPLPSAATAQRPLPPLQSAPAPPPADDNAPPPPPGQ